MPARAPQPAARPDLADADRGVRPVVRGDCLGGERPCPLVTCKHNLAVYDVLALPANATDDDVAATLLAMRHTCALDVVDALPGGATLEEVGEAFDVTRERVRQIESKALVHVRALTKHRHKHLAGYLPSEDGDPLPSAQPRASGVRVRFAEAQTPAVPPDAHRHLPLVGTVERASETFWCGKLVAAVRASLCVARQVARYDNGRHAAHPLCASCPDGHALAARVADHPESMPQRHDAPPETTPAPADAPCALDPEETPAMKPDANHAHDHAPTETDADDARARYDDGVRVAAPPRCGKCGIHPVATVTEKTRPDETTWCISCRRISTMTINGSSPGNRGAPALPGPCPRPGCDGVPARMMPGTPEEFARLCGEDRRHAQNSMAKRGITPAEALAAVCRAPRGQRYNGAKGAAPEEAASKSPAPTRATKPSAAKVPPPAKPAAASPATPATGEPVEVVHVAAAPAPLDLPPRTLDEERVRFEATMRGLNDAGRALAVAKKVGGVENLEALVTRALLLAL